MKKGFTLIETLAVLIILAVVIGITVPTYNYIKEGSKKALFKQAVVNVNRAITEDYELDFILPRTYTISNKVITDTYDQSSVAYQGELTLEGQMIVDTNENVYINVCDDNWCFVKAYDVAMDDVVIVERGT